MTLPTVRFLPEAVEDLLETQRWYGLREPALAQEFTETVWNTRQGDIQA